MPLLWSLLLSSLFWIACDASGTQADPEAGTWMRFDAGSAAEAKAPDAASRETGTGDAARADTVQPATKEAGAPATATDASSHAGSASDGSSASDAAPTSVDAAAPPTSVACDGAAFCADFEGEAPGPIAGAWSAKTPNCSGDGDARIDDSVGHDSARSLRVQSGGGTCNHVFATPEVDLRSFGDALWVRFYVRFEHELSDAHVTFLALADQVTQKALRMGGQKKILMWNRESDDATLPELSPVGVSLSVAPKASVFHCVEFHLAGSQGTLETYFEGALVDGLVVDGIESQDIDGQWLRPGVWRADVTELGFGWESYGGDPMTLWFDDIVVAGERVGC